jgi:titin
VKYARVGGNTAADRNVISGNAWEGVAVGRHVSDNKVQGNYIGTDKTGTFAIPNGVNGVTLWDMAERTTIGGTQPGQGNVISGNREHGIHIVDGGTDDNLIQGNYIGTDATGLLPLGNVRDGIRIGDGGVPQRNLIGGPTANARNVISANGEYGVMIGWSSDSNTVQGNYIGTDKTGTADLGNTLSGVYVDGDCWFTTLADNVISGNDQYGIGSGGGSFSQIVGNYIGTAQDGILPLANGGDGIHLSDAGNDIQIGGSGTADRNIIAGNLGHGVYVNIDWNTLQGNFIGADVNGASLGNTGSGVYFDAGANDNLCQENLIIDNLDDGLTVKGWRNRLTRNSTYGNDDLGIDFWADGVTDPNPLKIDSITSNGDGTYTINGTAPANSTVEVFLADGDPSGYGEGPEFLAETTAAGDGSWSAVITADAGDPITATAYPHPSQRYNTSEFCANVNVPSG